MGSAALGLFLLAASSQPPVVRVLLDESAESVTISTDAPAAIVVPGQRRPIWRGRELGETTITPSPRGLLVGESEVEAVRVQFASQGLWRLGDRAYAGTIEVIRVGDGEIRIVNEVDFENYVMGVVGPEIGAGSPLEALKAQAVAARTYAWCRQRDRADSEREFDVYPDTRDQVYRGHPGAGTNVERAVNETCGQLLTWDGEPFTTYFHSTCGGRTRSVAEWSSGAREIPPLAGAECGHCDGTRYADWTVDVTADDLGDWVSSAIRSIEVVEVSTRSGYPLTVRITSDNERTMTSSEFRSRVGTERVRSPYFTVRAEDGRWIVEGHGWGHGVGMCQMGAISLGANRGYGEILELYYPNSTLRSYWRSN